MLSDSNGDFPMAGSPDTRLPSRRGQVSRRDFLGFCSAVATTLGLGLGGTQKVYAALTAGLRPPVLWLHFAECTGCTEALLRTTSPYFDDLILNTISLEYHETLMIEAGEGAEALRSQVLTKYAGEFFCVVEGSIPTTGNGQYGTVGSKTMLAIAEEVLPKAKAIIALGSCASDGGMPAATPNPAGCKGIKAALPSLKVPMVNCPGCPPNPVNFAAIIVNYLLKGTTPPLDSAGRPIFAYGKTVHQQCGQLGTAKCLQSQGCRGITTFHNCPQIKFNEGTSVCMQAGHVCIGCAEANFWDSGPFFSQPFWKTYTVKADAAKPGVTYSGNPNGILSTLPGRDAGVNGGSPQDAGVRPDASSGTGGATATGGKTAAGGNTAATGGVTTTGGSPTTGGVMPTGGAATGGAISPSSITTGGTVGDATNAMGCGCGVGKAAGNQALNLAGVLTLAAAIAVRVAKRTTSEAKGDACPESSSTPSPESKDT